ncbi:hypothetical protein [Aestuariimicrobium ganziense]|uniref:hypothetical protein n=1 Tax=Aestuariimicrobium ganziense TaxID=2773677 RepID=UPI0019413EEF|nr:hypothetical protein [Aestuariimicrobium ganziense]
MRVVPVDERDSSWESAEPRFRVYLHGSSDESTAGWTSTHDVEGGDVLQVIDWSQRQASGGVTYAVALVVDDADMGRTNPGHGRGLVWLVGRDGNDMPRDPELADAQRRMLARRAEPVGIPLTDRVPDDLPSHEWARRWRADLPDGN